MHSLLIVSELSELERLGQATINESVFAELFQNRLKDPKIKVCRALEYEFFRKELVKKYPSMAPLIEKFHTQQKKTDQKELTVQEKRLEVAEEKLEKKITKTAVLEVERAKRKIEKLQQSLKRFERREARPYDSRIFPFYFVPLVIGEAGKRWVQPLRFHCRPAGKSESFDRLSYGTYKARLESLSPEYFERIRYHTKEARTSMWEPLFGKKHGLLLVRRFYENVPQHLHEKRELKKGEKEKKIVLGFEPKESEYLRVPCLYDTWVSKDKKKTLHSFAMITQESPPDIQAEGYHRCPIFLKEENVEAWLHPEKQSLTTLYSILCDPQRPGYALVA